MHILCVCVHICLFLDEHDEVDEEHRPIGRVPRLSHQGQPEPPEPAVPVPEAQGPPEPQGPEPEGPAEGIP